MFPGFFGEKTKIFMIKKLRFLGCLMVLSTIALTAQAQKIAIVDLARCSMMDIRRKLQIRH